MSIFSNVTKKDMISLCKLAEQPRNQRALKIKNRILKETHKIKLAESLSPITEKLEEVKQSTKKIGDVIKEPNSENEINQEIIPVEIDSEGDNTKPKIRTFTHSSIFSYLMTKTLGSLMSSSTFLRIKSSPSGASILGVPNIL